jgi:UDP-N-acetylglucosamine--dolichyl-phosphate N-acetylglucosaminephosphotransferase
MLVKLGTSTMTLPFLGTVNLSLGTIVLPFLGPVGLNLYVLLLIPLGVVACSNLINLLAGFNGLEAGSGIIICLFLILIILLDGKGVNQTTALFLAVALLGALLAFLIFNWYPAQVFPGNIVTYLIGASIAAIVIIANIEKAGIILLLPQIIEFFLKALSKFHAENYGTPVKGRLTYSGSTRSLTHLLMKAFKPTEPQLVLMLWGIQILAGLLAVATMLLRV